MRTPTTRLAALAIVALVAAGCASPATASPAPTSSPVATSSEAATGSPAPSASPAGQAPSVTPPPVSEEAAVAAATNAAGSSIPVTALSIRLSTYGAESQHSSIVDGSTPVWAVLLSGSFDWPSCGPMQWGTTPQPCPSPASTIVVLIDAGTGAFVQADMPAPSPPATLPSGGIPLERAIALARSHSSLTTFVSASAGAFGDLAQEPSIGPSYAITLDQLVWAVTFVGDMTICPPLAAPSGPGTPAPAACWSPRPGQTIVLLDYRTGDFLTAAGYSPPAP